MAQDSTQSNVDVNLKEASDGELLAHVGEKVTMHGKWSLRGKIGPYILAGNRSIYVVSQESFSWGEEYARMEGQEVRVTGVLHFAHYAAPNKEKSSDQNAPDHFYFEAETTKIELNGS